MKEIIVNDDLGSCVITSKVEIKLKNEFAIKALAGLQIMLLDEDGPGMMMEETLRILKKAIDDISELHGVEHGNDSLVIRDEWGS